jgi:NAD(P)-dependent dehydrogenase (short-subunit alcohol dehydrogenase family)
LRQRLARGRARPQRHQAAVADDVAKAAAFLASAESDYMTGLAVNVTGGGWMV